MAGWYTRVARGEQVADRERAQGVPPADRTHPARLRSRHDVPLRHLLRADGGRRLHQHRLQDEAIGGRLLHVALRAQRVLQRLVERTRLHVPM